MSPLTKLKTSPSLRQVDRNDRKFLESGLEYYSPRWHMTKYDDPYSEFVLCN